MVAEYHLRNNSWTTIEKCSDSTQRVVNFNLNGTTSWPTTLLKSEKSIMLMTEEIPLLSILEDKSYQKLSQLINLDNNSLEIDI